MCTTEKVRGMDVSPGMHVVPALKMSTPDVGEETGRFAEWRLCLVAHGKANRAEMRTHHQISGSNPLQTGLMNSFYNPVLAYIFMNALLSAKSRTT